MLKKVEYYSLWGLMVLAVAQQFIDFPLLTTGRQRRMIEQELARQRAAVSGDSVILMMTDRVDDLLHQFSEIGDTLLLEEALKISCQLIESDTTKEAHDVHIGQQYLILLAMGRDEDAKLLSWKPWRENDSVQWLLYEAKRCNLYGKPDSCVIYANRAIGLCEKELKDGLNVDRIIRMANAYELQGQRQKAVAVLQKGMREFEVKYGWGSHEYNLIESQLHLLEFDETVQ